MKFFRILQNFFLSPLEDVLFPPLCFLCEDPLRPDRRVVCDRCWKALPKYNWSTSAFGFTKIFSQLYILFEFNEAVRMLIHLFKYRRFLTLAKYFADQAVNQYPALINTDYDAIIPVPLHQLKYRERGYNQSSILATYIGEFLNKSVLDRQLTRLRNTPSQTNLSKEMRKKNVEDAFKVIGCPVSKKILLVDDVITTGSTANECTKVLMNAGAERVDIFALANPILTQDNLKEEGKHLFY